MPHSSGDPSITRSASSTAAPAAAAATRNVLSVVLGDTLFKTWYPSFYPEDIVGRETERLCVCKWCFKYTPDSALLAAHAQRCELRHGPPGRLIYRKAPYEIVEVDGAKNKIFAQNLSLFAKLFLDNKSVFFDVFGFKYYILLQNNHYAATDSASFTLPTSPSNNQTLSSPVPTPLGFFSKEKMSWDNNNLACILIFPPYQRQGLGKILMGVSYELSARERRIGGPEKPLSELGRRSYMRFWQARIARTVLGLRNKSSVEVDELAMLCAMSIEDTVTTLKEMGLCELRKKDSGCGLAKARVREWAVRMGVGLDSPVADDGFVPLEESETEEGSEEESE